LAGSASSTVRATKACTGPQAPRHKGLTFFINLEVPAENVVGRENGGWAVAITTLMFERGPRALSRQLILRQGIAGLLELARARGCAADPVMRQRLVATPGPPLAGGHHHGRHPRDHEEHPGRAGSRTSEGLEGHVAGRTRS
jgi:alkylation response protein AidB-like acyl-CoA dehydrogenase